MSEETTHSWSEEIKELGEKLVALTIKKAQELKTYLKEVHGIEPAAGGGAVMMAAPAAAEADEPAEKTEFDVILASPGDAKIGVIKVVRTITGLTLKEAKDLVDACPKPIKEKVRKDEADKIKSEIEAAGGAVEIK
ncbi:MAG: 50S ribosomal protein L7/L12 [Planctomycetes bacterium]|nr:50S ribosomal protein L7/L12 [Planctomycetota bacterium]